MSLSMFNLDKEFDIMALVKCRECGKEISDKAKTCVHCGYHICLKNINLNLLSSDLKDSFLYDDIYRDEGIKLCLREINNYLRIYSLTDVTEERMIKFLKKKEERLSTEEAVVKICEYIGDCNKWGKIYNNFNFSVADVDYSKIENMMTYLEKKETILSAAQFNECHCNGGVDMIHDVSVLLTNKRIIYSGIKKGQYIVRFLDYNVTRRHITTGRFTGGSSFFWVNDEICFDAFKPRDKNKDCFRNFMRLLSLVETIHKKYN